MATEHHSVHVLKGDVTNGRARKRGCGSIELSLLRAGDSQGSPLAFRILQLLSANLSEEFVIVIVPYEYLVACMKWVLLVLIGRKEKSKNK